MDWLLIYAVGGFFYADVRTEHVTEAQCRAIYDVAPRKDEVRCLSPDGVWYPRKPD